MDSFQDHQPARRPLRLGAVGKPRVWVFHAMLGAAVAMGVALLMGEPVWALGFGLFTALAFRAVRVWSLNDPTPMPYGMRWLLHSPRPCQSSRRLDRLLEPRRGEHILEIGPGIGRHSLPIVVAVGPDGVLETLDVQREMLDHLLRRAAKAGIANIVATEGDARKLPYPDKSFDGAYLISVLGEVPGRDVALRELRRVLKPNGRLVVGEIFIDPDFVPLPDLRRRASRAGFAFERKTGFSLAYLARLKAA